MKPNRKIIITLILLIIVAALYRVIPNRPMGFAPQWAMALFAGSVIKDKKWALALPIFSLFISDLIYQALYIAGLSSLSGFYEGQLTNYILFGSMTVIGFYMKRITIVNIAAFSLYICLSYYILSNFFVWINDAGFARPKTFAGLMLCYEDGLPFLRNSIIATLVFSGVLFGAWRLITDKKKLFVPA